jgi:hypothetical protein
MAEIEFNPFTGKFDFVGGSSEFVTDNVKLKFHLESLKAFDKIVSVNYNDQGLVSQHIQDVVQTSTLYPDATITKTFYYLDVGTRLQRVEKVEYTGAVFDGDSIRKNYLYDLDGVRLGYNYEVF